MGQRDVSGQCQTVFCLLFFQKLLFGSLSSGWRRNRLLWLVLFVVHEIDIRKVGHKLYSTVYHNGTLQYQYHCPST